MPRPTVDLDSFSAPQPRQASLVTQKSVHGDWNSMEKMKQSSDDKAVSNLLNMVAQLKGKKAEKLLKKHHIASSEDNALSGDLAAWGDAPEEVPVMAPVATQSAPEEVPVAAPVIAAPVAPKTEIVAPVIADPAIADASAP